MSETDLYTKYPNIIPGSVANVPRGDTIICGHGDKIVSHGTVCVIKCMNAEFSPVCLKTRMINIQDLGQVTKCKPCTKADRNMRRRATYRR